MATRTLMVSNSGDEQLKAEQRAHVVTVISSGISPDHRS